MPDAPITPSTKHRDMLAGLAFGLLGVAIWSGSFVLTRLGVKTSLNPYDIIALRFGFGGLVLLPVIWKKGFALPKLGWLGFVLLVTGAGAPYALLSAIGLQFAPASQAAALIPGSMTVMVAVVGATVLGERLSPRRWTGVGMIVVGSLLISGLSIGHQESIGHLIFVFAAALWTGYVFVLRKAGLTALHATAIAAVGSAIIYLPVYAALIPKQITEAPMSDIVLQALYQGGMTTVVGLIVFNQAVRLLGAAAGAALSALIPVVTLILGTVFLHEIPTVFDILCALIISAGVFLLAVARLPDFRSRLLPFLSRSRPQQEMMVDRDGVENHHG